MGKVYLSEFANPILVDYLKKLGYETSFVFASPPTFSSVSAHPDVYLCKLGFRKVFYGKPDTVGPDYPDNAKYNAVCMGKYFIHKLDITGEELLSDARYHGKVLINVPQAYTKCNMVILHDKAAITSDLGIAKALEETDIDLLTIAPGYVLLKGFPHGFIGGTSGLVGDRMIFHGNLPAHPDFERIRQFFEKHRCHFVYFEEFELEDIGSIIEF